MLPYDGSIEAIYEDGFILDETSLGDVSPYNERENVLRAIINKDAEVLHGRMVSFSLFYKNQKYTIDWATLPDNARPIRFKKMEADFVGAEMKEIRTMGVDFGYQYLDENGDNHQEIMSL